MPTRNRVRRHGPVTLIGDKGYAGREFAEQTAERDVTFLRPRRTDESAITAPGMTAAVTGPRSSVHLL